MNIIVGPTIVIKVFLLRHRLWMPICLKIILFLLHCSEKPTCLLSFTRVTLSGPRLHLRVAIWPVTWKKLHVPGIRQHIKLCVILWTNKHNIANPETMPCPTSILATRQPVIVTGWRKLWRANKPVKKKKKKKKFRISRIPFQVGNSATIPRPFIVIND